MSHFRDILRGPKLKVIKVIKVIVQQQKIMSRSFLNNGTLIVIMLSLVPLE
jgi:hypothetical protein